MSSKLYLLHKQFPYATLNNSNVLSIKHSLAEQMYIVDESSRNSINFFVRPESGFVIIETLNTYSLHWVANELAESPDYIVYKYQPEYIVSVSVPRELNPTFNLNVISNVFIKNNRHTFNSVYNWTYEQIGQTRDFLNYFINIDTKSLFQLIGNKFMLSTGTRNIQAKLIGIANNGIEYGQSESFEGIFSSLDHQKVRLGRNSVREMICLLYLKKERIFQGERLPIIDSIIFRNGLIKVKCPNQFSLEWVVESVEDMNLQLLDPAML